MFKIGDKVRLKEGVVTNCTAALAYGVTYFVITGTPDKRGAYSYDAYDKKGMKMASCAICLGEDSFELINNNSIDMSKISSLQETLLDKNTKVLIEAGFLDEKLALTEEGKTELQSLFFADYKERLIKVAEAKIKEAKKNSSK